MAEPLVSAHITTYNHAGFIGAAIEGVLNQKTAFPFELVIGEDCSTDRTREIVMEYQRKHPAIIRAIVSDTNVGAKRNFYRTMKACRGKYVALCDGDDFWHDPLKLQKQIEYLECHPECSMMHSSYDVYHQKTGSVIKNYLAYRRFHVPQDPDISDVLTGCRNSFRIQTCTVMVRRTVLEHIVEADPYLHLTGPFLMGDVQLWAELSQSGRIGFLEGSLATYRLLDESASRSTDKSKSIRFERSQQEMGLYLCEKHNLSPNVKRALELAWCEFSLRQAFHEQNADLAVTVKNRKGSMKLKEWLLFLGAINKAAHSVLSAGAFCRDLITNERDNLRA